MLRKRIKKKKPLITNANTKSKLHSNSKSTYFYKQWSSWTSACHNIFANGLRWSSRHCEQNSSGFRLRDGANPTRSSLVFKNPYSKNAYGRLGLNKSYILPVVCSLALLLVAGLAINPFAQGESGEKKAYAEEGIAEQADTTNMSVSLTMADPDKTLLQQNAKAGEMSYISSGFTVTTENVDGYNVYVQTAPGSTNKLTNGNITIDFVTTETPTSNFTDNTWGYAVDDTGTTVENLKYNPIPDTASIMNPAYTSNSTGETRNFTLNFATKFAKDATPGHYTSGVLLSVAAGADEVTIFEEPTGFISGDTTIYNMQDMTTAICSNAAEGTTGRLRDIRDMKVYWVTKLPDNNCWMTQNLDLDLKSSQSLSSMDTDITTAWTPITTRTGTVPFSGSSSSPNTVRSWDPGYYLYTLPTEKNDCGDTTTLAGCTGWVNVSDNISWRSSNDPDFTQVIDVENNIYDAHYLVGNYYSWSAVIAGQAASLTSSVVGQQSTQSICSKGWRLPIGATDGEFMNLVTGLKSSQITSIPYYFVRGGYGATSNSYVRLAGRDGQYWTATAYSASEAYYFKFSDSPASVTQTRSYGLPVRCVAR